MPDTSVLPSVDELFRKWKQFLDRGTLTTATDVAGDYPELVDPLQLLINSYIEQRAAGVDETLTAAIREPRVPETTPVLPDYTVLGPLGEGGMGVVYRVRDALDREWALKLARHGQLNDAGRERFYDEAKAMSRLHHPNVAAIHDYRVTPNGRPYFLMPIYPGNLTSRLSDYQSDLVKAVRLMTAVAEGVGHLHAEGFVHRDLKPHNILLDAHGQPAVSDFGLVKSLSEVGSEVPADSASGPGSAETRPSGAKRSRTVAGVAVGTRAYMAPEQAAGFTHLSNPKWDVWALGVILHELATGRRPPSSDAPQRLLDPKQADNPPPSVIKPGLDPRLERIIQRCLARTEDNRYADSREVAQALRAWRPVGRAPRRQRWVVFTGIVLIGLVAGIWAGCVWLPSPDTGSGTNNTAPKPDDPLPWDTADPTLVQFIPGWRSPTADYRWTLGKSFGFMQLWPTDQAPTFDTRRSALVEFLAPGERDIVLVGGRTRINHRTPISGRAGVYAGATSVQTTKGKILALIDVGYCDQLRSSQGSMRDGAACLSARLIGIVPDHAEPLDIHVDVFELFRFSTALPGGKEDEPFHDLTLELTTSRARAWFDRNYLAEASTEELAETLRRTARELGVELHEPIVFRPSGGAGVFVSGANASYQRFRAGPAPHR